MIFVHMFWNAKLRRRVEELEKKLAMVLEQNKALLNVRSVIAEAAKDAKDELTAQFERELGPKIRALAVDIAREEVGVARGCGHDQKDTVIIAVTTFPGSMPECEFGNLFAVNEEGAIVKQKTCYTSVVEDQGGKPKFKVFARKCLKCGKVYPVDWFDVAAAGSAVVDREHQNQCSPLYASSPDPQSATLDEVLRG